MVPMTEQRNRHRLFLDLFPWLVAWILQHRWWVLAFISGVTLWFAAHLPQLEFSTSVYDLIIEDLPENQKYEDFKSIFGSEAIIRIVVKSEDIYDPSTLEMIGRLADDAAALKGVQRVISLTGIKKLIDPTNLWTPQRFKDTIAAVPLFQSNLVSEDGRTTAITLVLNQEAVETDVILAVNDLIAAFPKRASLYQIGIPLVSEALARFTQHDFVRLPPITFVLVACILVLLFRKFTYALITLSCVSLTLIWTFGAISMSGAPLSILTLIVPVFLIAVGTAYCLHIMAEFRHRMKGAQSAVQAVLETYGHCTFPTVLAVLTTVFGLASLLFNRIVAIKIFALFACGGMVGLLLILTSYLPVILSFLHVTPPKTDQPACEEAPGLLQRLIDLIVRINLDHQKLLFTVLAVIVVTCALGILRLKVETNPMGYFKPETDVSRNFHDIYRHLSGSFPVHVEMVGPSQDYYELPEHIAAIDQMVRFAETLPGVDKAISFPGYLKLVGFATNGFDPAYYRLPEEPFEVRMLINGYRSLLGPEMLRAFMDPTFTRTNILLLTHISSSRDFLKLRQEIEAHTQTAFSRDLQWNVTGFGVVISASSRQLTIGQLKSLSVTMLLVFAIMFMLFLSAKVGLVAIATNLFPIVVNFGIMGWLGIELSMGTSLIAGVAVGLAVDDTIHYLVRFNSEFKKDLDDRRALQATLNRIGRPVIWTTLTIGVGFCVLLFSSFKPTAVFGFLMVTTMLAALVGDLLLLPSLMRHVELVTLWDLARVKLGKDPSVEIRLFEGLSRTEVHSILMAGTLKPIPAGQILFRKGEPSNSMFALLSGRLEVLDYDDSSHQSAEEGSQKLVNIINAGDIVGEMGLLRAAPRSATVIARETGELLPINWKMIRRIQWLYPPTAMKLFTNLLIILSDRVENLTRCMAQESLVDDLTNLCNRRAFCRLIETEIHRACRQEGQLCLLVFEVRFKNMGSAKIDEGRRVAILSQLGRLIALNTRHCDCLGRIDARRFAVLAHGNANGETRHLQQRLLKEMDELRKHFADSPFFMETMSVDVPLKPDQDGATLLSAILPASTMDPS
jgi:diguanylate cyclase (GGDEF)-like protein